MKTVADVKWIVERDIFDDDNPERMVEILRAKGNQVKVVGYVPFEGSIMKVMDGIDRHVRLVNVDKLGFDSPNPIVVYGSLNMCSALCRKSDWYPTAWYDLQNLKCATYYARWGKYLLQQRYVMMPFGEFRRKRDFLFSAVGETDCVFVRPDNNAKTFTGEVVAKEDFEAWAKKQDEYYNIDPEMMVVVAQPCNIVKEWRFVVCERKVITGSQYKEDRRLAPLPGFPPEAKAVVERVIADEWQPDDMYTVDVCQTKDGDFSVLEIGSFNGAGLYKCELEPIIDAANALAVKQWNDLYS